MKHISWDNIHLLSQSSWILLDGIESDSDWEKLQKFKFILVTKTLNEYNNDLFANVQQIRITHDKPCIRKIPLENNAQDYDIEMNSIVKEIQGWEPEIDHLDLYRKCKGTLVKVEATMKDLGFWCARQIVLDYCHFRISKFQIKNYELDNWKSMASPLLKAIVKESQNKKCLVLMEKSSNVKMVSRFLTLLLKDLKIGYFCGKSNNLLGSICDIWDHFNVVIMTARCFKNISLTRCQFSVVIDNCLSINDLKTLQKLTQKRITFIITSNQDKLEAKISHLVENEDFENQNSVDFHFDDEMLKEIRNLVTNSNENVINLDLDLFVLKDILSKLNSNEIQVNYAKEYLGNLDWNGYRASFCIDYNGSIARFQTGVKLSMSLATDVLIFSIEDLIVKSSIINAAKEFREANSGITLFHHDKILQVKNSSCLMQYFEGASDYANFYAYLFIPQSKAKGHGFAVFLLASVNAPSVYFLKREANWSTNINQNLFSISRKVQRLHVSQIDMISRFQKYVCSDLVADLKSGGESTNYLFCPILFELKDIVVEWNIYWDFISRKPIPMTDNGTGNPSDIILRSKHNGKLYRCLGIENNITLDTWSNDLQMTFRSFFEFQGYDDLTDEVLVRAKLITPATIDDLDQSHIVTLLGKACLIQPYDWSWYVMFQCFKSSVLSFEAHAVMSEFNDVHELDLKLNYLLEACLAPCAQDEFNFEKLEFLGDSILKYLVTIDLWKIIPTEAISPARALIVSNQNLYLFGQKLMLKNILKTYPLRGKNWVPPYFSHSNPVLDSFTPKMIADCFEALVGAIYLCHGLNGCRDFLYRTGIIVSLKKGDASFNDLCLNEHGVQFNIIEKSLGYCFSDKNLLRLALCANLSNEEDYHLFRRLECLGDAALELCSTIFLYKSYGFLSVGDLNDHRQTLICNRNFAMLAHRHGLVDTVSKLGSDIWEAVCGAILIDLDWNFKDFSELVLPHIMLSFTIGSKSPVRKMNELSQSDLFKDSDFDYRFSRSEDKNCYVCHIWLDHSCIASGIGRSKSEAKRNACDVALSSFSAGSSFGCLSLVEAQ